MHLAKLSANNIFVRIFLYVIVRRVWQRAPLHVRQKQLKVSASSCTATQHTPATSVLFLFSFFRFFCGGHGECVHCPLPCGDRWTAEADEWVKVKRRKTKPFSCRMMECDISKRMPRTSQPKRCRACSSYQ